MLRWPVFTATALAVLLIDRITKGWVLGNVKGKGAIEVAPFLNIVYVGNKGGAFGIGRHRGGFVFILASIAAIAVVITLTRRIKHAPWYIYASLGAVAGGGLGNLIDRFVYGRVVDFIDLHLGKYHWPAFNVADTAIVLGVITFALLYKRCTRT